MKATFTRISKGYHTDGDYVVLATGEVGQGPLELWIAKAEATELCRKIQRVLKEFAAENRHMARRKRARTR